MWKSVARNIGESLKFRTCKPNIYPQTSQDSGVNEVDQNTGAPKKKPYTPTFPAYFRCCSKVKPNSTKEKEKDDKWDAGYSWTDAVGWVIICILFELKLIKVFVFEITLFDL